MVGALQLSWEFSNRVWHALPEPLGPRHLRSSSLVQVQRLTNRHLSYITLSKVAAHTPCTARSYHKRVLPGAARQQLNQNALDLAQADFVVAPVVELGGAG